MTSHKRFHVIPELNMSLASPQEMDMIFAILKRWDVSFFKITTGQRLALYDVEPSTLRNIRHELLAAIPHAPEISVNYVHTCPDLDECKYVTRNSKEIGRALEQLSFATPFPNKVKIGIAGCKMCCTEPFLRDIGIIGSKKGWTLSFGGNGGGKPRIGDIIAKKLNDEQLLNLVNKCLKVYREKATTKQRTARFIESYGLDNFLHEIQK